MYDLWIHSRDLTNKEKSHLGKISKDKKVKCCWKEYKEKNVLVEENSVHVLGRYLDYTNEKFISARWISYRQKTGLREITDLAYMKGNKLVKSVLFMRHLTGDHEEFIKT